MKIGILADIHESLEYLRPALEDLDRRQVDQVVVLGDVCETGERLAETVELLASRGAVGVWGNHDFGVCRRAVENPAQLRKWFSDEVLDFFARLRPSLEIEGCLFSHVEPWRDLNDEAELWLIGQPVNWKRCFQRTAQRMLFVGHFHYWQVAGEEGTLEWGGAATLRLDRNRRYVVVVNALCNGSFAVFDTETPELIPHNLRTDSDEPNPM